MFYFLEEEDNMIESKRTCVCKFMPMHMLNILSVFTKFIRKLCQWNPTELEIINFISNNIPDAQTGYTVTTVTILQ